VGLVFCAERINSLGSEYWEKFSTQNYFDERGVFISTLYSVPLILNAVLILGLFLVDTAKLLILVKVKQIKHENRVTSQKQKKE
jgi:hypothetical protein